MNSNFLNFIKRIGPALGILVVCCVGVAYFRSVTFRVVETNPSQSNVTIISPFFDIDFDKPISSNVNVSSNPNVISSFSVNSKTLVINLSIPLNPKTTYTITVSNIYDSTGSHMGNLTYSFTPQDVNSNNLPKDQSQALLNNQAEYSKNILNNPLLQLLPFTGPNFEYTITYTVQYGASGPSPIIQITAPDTQSQQDALAWISAQGYNPSSLDIVYINSQPQ